MVTVGRAHHIGVPVSSIDVSLPFYKDVLGLTEAGIAGGGEGDEMSQALEVDGAKVRFVFLTTPEGDLIELLEYANPREPFGLRNCDVGAVHVCFEVEDMDAAHQALKDKGVHINHPPIDLDESNGDLAGYSFMYFRDPDGVQLEFYTVPEGGQ
jgi:catechol 2,3-dioxygenase-like lactoylglutathione lyase family enzyme